MALVIDGAMQHAPQPARHEAVLKGEGGATGMRRLSSRVARRRQPA
jgi:hypothetical protein